MISDERGTVTWQPERGAAVVTLCGDIDFELSEQATDVMEQAAAGGVPVIVDLSQTRFADSSLLNLLLRAGQRHQVLIAGPVTDAVMRIFDVTGTTAFFDFHPDVAAAHDAIR